MVFIFFERSFNLCIKQFHKILYNCKELFKTLFNYIKFCEMLFNYTEFGKWWENKKISFKRKSNILLNIKKS